MIPRTRKASAVSQVMRKGAASLDWDATVREAFLGECVRQGIRAELATEALRDALDPATEASLRAVIADATDRAARGWLDIETCLEQFGELAALALERTVEEAAVQTRSQRGLGPISERRPRTSQLVLRHRDDAASRIVRRGRERVARFWADNGSFAA